MTPGRASERFKPYLFVLQREGLSHEEFSQKFVKGTITDYLLKADLIQVTRQYFIYLLTRICLKTQQRRYKNTKISPWAS